MKKLFVLGSFIALLVIVFINHGIKSQRLSPISSYALPSSTPTIIPIQQQNTYLFVPYWSLTKKQTPVNYNSLIYFGITPNENGIDTNDIGYGNIETFTKKFSSPNTYLALRMTNQQINNKVLKDKALQDKIISSTIQIAQKNNFNGIVLDFEVSALSFDSVVNSISDFQKKFYSQTTHSKITLLTTIYGDTFYRLRPYNVKVISQNTDKVLIMAYDFHKAKGNPGPNFPLKGKATYGYDLEQMTTDFIKNVPIQKLNVVMGMFGYDWTVDDKDESTTQAEPLSLAQIQQKFLQGCNQKACIIKRDPLSSETTISYMDSQKKKHIVWFEDLTSSSQKKTFLKDRGIPGIGFWAHSYF